jgi:DNA adenine methylase
MGTAISIGAIATDVLHAAPEPQTPWQPTIDMWLSLRSVANTPDVSPLRYPGGKRKLAVLVGQIFATAQRRIELLVEPFAGGAAVSIALLEAGFAERIALADADPMVAAFWRTVFSDRAEHLARMVERAKVTVAERARIAASRPRSDLGLAYKCLFINRTSFSGIVKETAGVIGGNKQRGRYKIGCRFNQQRIADRIRALSKFRDRVLFVKTQTYGKTLRDIRTMCRNGMRSETVFWYFDPPFFEQASRLYRYCFRLKQHVKFKKDLDKVPGAFVLSYDDVPAAEKLYGSDDHSMAVPLGRMRTRNLNYVAAQNEVKSTQEIIVSNLLTSKSVKISVHNKARFLADSRKRIARR